MNKSRQEQAFDKLMMIFFALINLSKDIENKEDLKAELHEIFDYPVVRENLVQAFSNFMWDMDETIERQVVNEIAGLLEMIPKIADPKDKNTLAIMANLTLIVDSSKVPAGEMSDAETNFLVTDDEFDNSPIPGVK